MDPTVRPARLSGVSDARTRRQAPVSLLTSLHRSRKIDPVALVVQLLRRCAWCDRVLTSEGWRHAEESDRETSTICPDCVAKLQAAGLSVLHDKAETG